MYKYIFSSHCNIYLKFTNKSGFKVNRLSDELLWFPKRKINIHFALTAVMLCTSCGMYLTELKFQNLNQIFLLRRNYG